MCIHGLGGVTDVGFIDRALAVKAIDQCSELGVYSIKFNFRGEPLLHPDIAYFVRYAKEKNIMEVQFNTNGLPISKQGIEELIDAGLDRIIFSVDGANKETYERIRVGGNFDRLLGNIDTFLDIKRDKCLKRPFIRVQMVKYYGAEDEADQFIDYWTNKKVDNIAIIQKQDRENKEGYPLKDGKRPTGRTFCEQPWQRLNVNRDGKVLMCCGDWDRKVIVGDLSEQTLREIWKSRRLKSLRSKISKGMLDKIPSCKNCFRPTTYRWD